MKELGEYLRETRENNYVSIAEAAEDLKIPEITISNIESGNTRAFRDMYELKDKVKEYAKYLGLDPEKVVDEFNDFLFEHTSKISLKDILEAEEEEKSKEEAKKVASPYTAVKKKTYIINKKYTKQVGACLILLLILIALLLGISVYSYENQKVNVDEQIQSTTATPVSGKVIVVDARTRSTRWGSTKQ